MPTPASPEISSSADSPPARSIAARLAAPARARPTKTGLTTPAELDNNSLPRVPSRRRLALARRPTTGDTEGCGLDKLDRRC